MLEFWRQLESGNGPVFLKLDHLADETLTKIENVLHVTERPTRGLFHEGRHTDHRTDLVEMHISEIDPARCTEYVGHYGKPQCIEVCPIDCIIAHPDWIESQDHLAVKFRSLTGRAPGSMP